MKLHGRIRTSRAGEPAILRITRNARPVDSVHDAFLVPPDESLDDAPSVFAAVIHVTDSPVSAACNGRQVAWLPSDFAYLGEGDVVRINPAARHINVLYRRHSPHNSLLLTERCNSNCMMCSQPPRDVDDGYIIDDVLEAIPLMSPETESIGITGGEPTLLHKRFLAVLQALKSHLPTTAVHVLSNGRLLSYRRYAARIAAIEHPDLMLGIPLYSDLPSQHDFVVQARGAFDQTIRGLLNLGRYGVLSEIRVVVHRQTFARLPELARFIARNLPFVNHVAFMGLEMMGHVKMNLDALWIDPVDYQGELCEAVHALDRAGLQVSVYNHQLCLIDPSLRPFARQSISDWKNIYLPECERCAAKEDCGGFFASALLRYSDHIVPFGS